jgi:hypothetical protein
MIHTRFGLIVLLSPVICDSAAAQLRDPPPKTPAKEMKYFRVTITNQSDVSVVFTMQWDGKASEKVTLDPGKQIVAETKQPPAPKKPQLTVTYTPAAGVKDDIKTLDSGHVDPTTKNPGIIYDFQKIDTNLGTVVTLKPH